MIRTKIVCTLGPATDSEDTIQALVEAGMTVARINFSHGTHEDHARQIAFVRRAASDGNRAVAVLADLQGPKLRVGTLPGQQIELVPGRSVRLALADASQDPGMIPIPHAEVLRDVEVNETTVTAQAGYDDPINRGFPGKDYTIREYPGLSAR